MRKLLFISVLIILANLIYSCKTHQASVAFNALEFIQIDKITWDVKKCGNSIIANKDEQVKLANYNGSKVQKLPGKFMKVYDKPAVKNLGKAFPQHISQVLQHKTRNNSTEVELFGLGSFILTGLAYSFVLIPPLYLFSLGFAFAGFLLSLFSLLKFSKHSFYQGKGFALTGLILSLLFLFLVLLILPEIIVIPEMFIGLM